MASEENPLNKNTPLHDLMGNPLENNGKIMRLLNKDDPPVDVNVQNTFGQTPMMVGILSQDLDDSQLIQTILKRTDFDLTDKLGNTLLHYFTKHGIATCIDDILGKCNVLAQNNKGEMALHHVKEVNIMECVLKWYSVQGFNTEAKNWPENSLGKSELLTNLEDYLENPDKLPGKKDVIESFCDPNTNYPVPKDISDVILRVMQDLNSNSSDSMYGVLFKILKFGVGSIGEQHIKEAIKSDIPKVFNWTVEHCEINHIKGIIYSTDVLLACLKPKPKENGNNFYKKLLGLIDSDQLIDIKDNHGCNIAHYFCKYGKQELLQDLIEKDRDVVAELLRSTDNTNLYPLALMPRDPDTKFLEIFREYFNSPQKGFENITFASPTKDLLHFAIEKRKKYVWRLLDVDFPPSTDVNQQTPLHKIVRYYDHDQCSLLERVLTCQSEAEDIDYINKKDAFGFTALDYSILFKEEKQFMFLRQRNASFDESQIEKMINYLAFEKCWSATELKFILENLQISYPTEENNEHSQEIKRRLLKAQQAKQDKQLTSSQNKTSDPILFNILIAHSATAPIQPDLGMKQSDGVQTVVFCHSLPFEMLSIEHLGNFTNLINKQLFVVLDQKDPPLLDLLSKLFDVDANYEKNVPENFSLLRIGAKQLHIPQPSTDLLNHCPDQEIKSMEEKYRTDLVSHHGTSGYFFVSKCNGFYSRSFYNMSQEVSAITSKEALASFKLLDPFYTESGQRDFSKRIGSTWNPSSNSSSSKHFDFRAYYKGALNVSRFVTPLISSLLISKFMLMPRNGKIVLLSPDILVSFDVHTRDSLEKDFVRATICTESGEHVSNDVWQYFFSLLRSSEIRVDLKRRYTVDLLHRNRDDTIFESEPQPSEGDEPVNSTDSTDLEAADPLISPEKEPVEGSSLLLTCLSQSAKLSSTFRRNSIKLPVERYFPALDPNCDMLRENTGEKNIGKLLHRLVHTRKDYTIRQFVQDGGYTDKERAAICKGLGIDVGETYSKLYNCWRLNWADFLVLVLGIIIVVAILVGCEVGGIDLESYGVAGIATVPFILSLLNRVRMSYSHKPKYSELPDIHSPE